MKSVLNSFAAISVLCCNVNADHHEWTSMFNGKTLAGWTQKNGTATYVAKDGMITAATSSSISDGAAAVVLSRESVAKANGQQPVAKIVAMAAHAQEPAQFTVAPIGAIEKVLDKAGWSADEVELWEVNEAFACVAMFAMRDLGIPHDKINVNGGGTALGHPIGASGTRIIVTLLNALKQQGKTRGVASLCIGGGEATAVAVELV